jgi:2-acylglycerol O-acyltransferase 2
MIVGKPIRVEKIDNPSAEQVLKLHTLYLEKLKALYDNYKDVYHKDRIRDLTFVK